MTFRVGMKVVCISEWDNETFHGCIVPRLGEIYCIRDLEQRGIRLVEIVNSHRDVYDTFTLKESFDEPSFWQQNFRPVVERKTDISIFTEMLTKTGVDA